MPRWIVSGLAAPLGVMSTHPLSHGARQAFAPSAFSESLRRGDSVHLYVNHWTSGAGMASTDNETLAFDLRADGLYFWADVWKAEWIEIVRTAQRNGVLRGCSIGFQVRRKESVWNGDFVHEARLLEVSLTIGINREPTFDGTHAKIEVV